MQLHKAAAQRIIEKENKQNGNQWKREEVPAEIIEWLFNLPNTKVEPAWV